MILYATSLHVSLSRGTGAEEHEKPQLEGTQPDLEWPFICHVSKRCIYVYV